MPLETKKPTLDKDLDKLSYVEEATGSLAGTYAAPGLALLFIVLVARVVATAFVAGQTGAWIIVGAAAIGGYMALNIGANDVANNVGPAGWIQCHDHGYGTRVAAVFESAGALIAGGDVVGTISKGIIDVDAIGNKEIFIAVMMAALVSSALWMNLATWIGAPVSTTHSIVGGVMGCWYCRSRICCGQLANHGRHCRQLGNFAANGRYHRRSFSFISSRTRSSIKTTRLLPPKNGCLFSLQSWPVHFLPISLSRASGKLVKIRLPNALMIGLGSELTWVITKPLIAKQADGLENRNQSIQKTVCHSTGGICRPFVVCPWCQ